MFRSLLSLVSASPIAAPRMTASCCDPFQMEPIRSACCPERLGLSSPPSKFALELYRPAVDRSDGASTFPNCPCPCGPVLSALPTLPVVLGLAALPSGPLLSRPIHSGCRTSPSHRVLLELPNLSPTHHSRCLICGAPTPAAQRSTDPLAYPVASKSACTRSSQARPSLDATCSPRTTSGRHWLMRW